MYIPGARTVSAITCFSKSAKKKCLRLTSSSAKITLLSLYKQRPQIFIPRPRASSGNQCVWVVFFLSSCLFTVEFKLISALESKALELLWRRMDLVSFLGMRCCYLRLANECLQWKYLSRLKVVEASRCWGRGVVFLFRTNRNPEWNLFDQRWALTSELAA